MPREPLTMICCCDISGQVRGKGFPRRHLPQRLKTGIGWTPTNIQIMAPGGIADSPFGALGDLVLMPDPATETHVDFEDGTAPEHFLLADLLELDGRPWACCPRGLLKAVVGELNAAGLVAQVAFEHELVLTGANARPGDGYTLDAVRRHGVFGETFLGALESSGIVAESYLPEFGAGQFEVTVPPSGALIAADQAVIIRELARATAWRLGQRAIFSPIVTEDGLGNGVHIHISLRDKKGRPVTHDAKRPHELSATAAAFTAGIARHLPALCALTAPCPLSYLRLRPHRWSAAWNNVGHRDREAAIRLFPGLGQPERAAETCNIEFRAADAAACPYLQLAVVLRAGLEGVRAGLPLPPVTETDLEAMPEEERDALGLFRLPQSLGEALDRLAADHTALRWLPPALADVYLRHKHSELDAGQGRTTDELCELYAQVY